MNRDPLDGFGLQLQRARKQANLSQEKLGERLQVSTRTIRHYEAGTKTPHLSRLEQLALALGKPVGWFFSDGSARRG
jgi:transcriptional regulator with XRE-family HTH domain